MIITSLLVAGLVALATAYWLVRHASAHMAWTGDRVNGDPQKFHVETTSRVGGIAILIGALAGGSLLVTTGYVPGTEFLLIVVGALPVFLGGLAEDITKRVTPRARLWLSFLAAGITFFFLDAELRRLDLPWIDVALQLTPIAFVVTLFCVGGVAHAFNIIDGYNGLVAVVGIIIFTAIGTIGYQVGDVLVVGLSLAMMGALLGFFFLNFPRGQIFAGDGGAYFVGFMVAALSVILVSRNEDVSPWFPMLLCMYPVWETLFSIYRKRILRGISSDMPDGLHLHMLIYKRLVRYRVGSRDPRDRLARNSLTSPYLWMLSFWSALPATLFWNDTPVLMGLCAVFVVIYCSLYRSIIHFRAPRWLILRAPPAADAIKGGSSADEHGWVLATGGASEGRVNTVGSERRVRDQRIAHLSPLPGAEAGRGKDSPERRVTTAE